MVFDFIFSSYIQHSKVKKRKEKSSCMALSFHGAKRSFVKQPLRHQAPPQPFFQSGFLLVTRQEENLTQGFKMTIEHQSNSYHITVSMNQTQEAHVCENNNKSVNQVFLVLLYNLIFLFRLSTNLW
jgi:hypothetical protein